MIEEKDLPQEFVSGMKQMLGENYKKYIQALKEKAVRGIRVNTKKISVQDFKKIFDFEIDEISYEKNGFILNSDEKLGNTFMHLAGLYYFQEPSSMLPVSASQIENETMPLKILDLCASPGGKTGQIAVSCPKDSLIISNEVISSRANILFQNVERQGFKNVIITKERPENLLEFGAYFDYVFVDAPCSGEGMFRKDNATISEWNEKNQSACVVRQKEILSIAEKLVKPNGKLVYSTCTFSSSEDEDIADWFEQNFDFCLQEVPKSVKDVTIPCGKSGLSRKFLPFTARGEGQFVAVFKKGCKEESLKEIKTKKLKNISKIGKSEYSTFLAFAKENLTKNIESSEIIASKGKLFLLPPNFDDKILSLLDNLKFVSLGVTLGEIQKDRFIPNHSMFMALGDSFKIHQELDGKELKCYLHGEEIAVSNESSGYVPVTFSGFVLGGAKLKNGKLKNLYPKGLRL